MTMLSPKLKFTLAALLCALALLLPLVSLTARQAETAQLMGRIVDRDTGAPLAAELGIAIRTRQGVIFKHARADEAGQFMLADLLSGAVDLSTKHDGYAVEHAALTLGEQETQTLEFQLLKSKIVRGFISDEHQQPLADVHVKTHYAAADAGKQAFANSYQWETGDARTDAQGRFEVEVHPNREFIIEAIHPEFLSEVSAPLQFHPAAPTVTLRLSKGVTLTGEARDQTGNALANAQVELSDADERPALQRFLPFEVLQQRHQFTVSQADGTFRFEHVRPSRKLLLVTHAQHAPQQQTLELTAQQPVFNVNVTLR
ncbi:MAG: carboxypeptidase regulatory-like domain-containing protein [Acidobacteria bacterium]|nr:carboxypeptidase regulatory-like domain-containing protein [Acidobacteriota bacterium]MBI3421634.1 carboxypeptidase regulatory-like domain-containing protein [Acidobacteriota bacterium]